MPNKSRPHKRKVRKLTDRSAQNSAHSAFRASNAGSRLRGAHSVKDLLGRAIPLLSQAADQKGRQAFWRPWLEAHLPPGLPARITGITERDGNLVVFADSPAWSARLRYALQELGPRIRAAQPDINEVTVRVLPRTRQ